MESDFSMLILLFFFVLLFFALISNNGSTKQEDDNQNFQILNPDSYTPSIKLQDEQPGEPSFNELLLHNPKQSANEINLPWGINNQPQSSISDLTNLQNPDLLIQQNPPPIISPEELNRILPQDNIPLIPDLPGMPHFPSVEGINFTVPPVNINQNSSPLFDVNPFPVKRKVTPLEGLPWLYTDGTNIIRAVTITQNGIIDSEGNFYEFAKH